MRRFFLLFAVAVVLFLLKPSHLYSQETNPEPSEMLPVSPAQVNPAPFGQSWTCLNVKAQDKKKHIVAVYANPSTTFSSASPAYIVECYSLPSGVNTCASGDTNIDSQLGLNGPPKGWEIKAHPNQPVEITAEGKLKEDPVLWQSKGTPTATVHTFFLVQEVPPSPQLAASTGQAASLQLGTWAPNLTNYNSSDNCVSLNWDPTGFVFDSKSLEPIDKAQVTIFNADGSIFSDPTVTNPDSSEENGRYTFYVPGGTYSLGVKKASFAFPSTIDPLPFQSDPSFPYSNIYRGGTYDEPEGELVIKNIPIDSSGIPYRREAKILLWSYQLLNTENKYKFTGNVLHPKSEIKILNGTNLVGGGTANEFGQFEILIDSQTVNNTAGFTLTVEKPAIMKQTSAQLFPFRFWGVAQAQTASVKAEPILNYIEGYALDTKSGNPIPEALITVYMDVSSKPFYTTKADGNGYFKIPSQNLPTFPYHLEIKNPALSTSFTLTTSQFVAQNKEYPGKKKEVAYGKYQPEPTLSTNVSDNQYVTPAPKEDTAAALAASKKQTWGLIMALLVLIILLAAGVFFLLKKRQQMLPPTDKELQQPPNL